MIRRSGQGRMIRVSLFFRLSGLSLRLCVLVCVSLRLSLFFFSLSLPFFLAHIRIYRHKVHSLRPVNELIRQREGGRKG